MKPDVYVYIKSDPEVCHARIKERNRECETDVTLEYLKEVHQSYEEFVLNLSKVPVDIKCMWWTETRTKTRYSAIFSKLCRV